MPGILAALLLVAAPAPTTTAHPGPGPASPQLLDRLAQTDNNLDQYYGTADYLVTTHVQFLDPATGALKSENQVVTRMFRKDGKPWEEITLFTEAGKDETAAHAAQRESQVQGGKRKRTDGIPFKSPFGPGEQPRYTFTDEGPDPVTPALEKLSFTPHTAAKDDYVGSALVEVANGWLRHIQFHPAVKPNFVHTLEVVMDFTATTPAGPALTHIVVDGEGGLFFVKRRQHVDSVISGYQMPGSGTAIDAAGPAKPVE